MAYPTNSLALVLEDSDRVALQLKQTLQAQVATMAATSVNSSTVLGIYSRLKRDYDTLGALAATDGIAAYAKQVKNNLTLDVVAEFTAMRSAIASAVAWVDSNFPASGGFIQSHQISNGKITERSFSSAQTAGFRTVLKAVIATVE